MDDAMNEPFGNSPGNRIMPAMREALRPSGLDPGGRKRVEKRFGFSRKSRPFSGKIPGFNVIFRKFSRYYFFEKQGAIMQTGRTAARQMQTLPKSMQIPWIECLVLLDGLNTSKPVKVCQSDCAGFPSASDPRAGAVLGLAVGRTSRSMAVKFRIIQVGSGKRGRMPCSDRFGVNPTNSDQKNTRPRCSTALP